MNLLELGKKYRTDKVEHAYLPHYESRWGHLQDKPINFLEIGTWEGASLKMWREYFPQGRIIGFDLAPDWAPGPDDQIVLVHGDQSIESDMEPLAAYGPYDIIVDDGSHRGIHHPITWKFLWPHVKPGGWYAIEDCFSIYNICWTQPGERTIVDEFVELCPMLFNGKTDIAEVQFIGDGLNDGLIFFRKRL